MSTAWKGALLSVAIALAACDQSPTAAPSPPRVRGTPTTAPTDGVQRHGNVVVASGADADTLVRHTAARWAAQGNRALQAYVDTSSLWDGRGSRPAAGLQQPPDGGTTYTDLSYLKASISNQSLQITLNGNQAMVVSKADYSGTDAHMDLSFGANYGNGTVDIPAQTTGANDGHALQKLACAADLASGTIYPSSCIVWTGTVTATAQLILSHDCGEYVYASATTVAWFELPIPEVTLGSGGASFKLSWKKFGSTGPVAMGRKTANQPSCPTTVKKTPRCVSQLIYDPSACDGSSDGSILDAGGDSTKCQIYLVEVMESYDGGKTWVTVASWVQSLC